jgi:hypothetical protein
MDRACNKHGGEKKCKEDSGRESQKEIYLDDLDVGVSIILKWILLR